MNCFAFGMCEAIGGALVTLGFLIQKLGIMRIAV